MGDLSGACVLRDQAGLRQLLRLEERAWNELEGVLRGEGRFLAVAVMPFRLPSTWPGLLTLRQPHGRVSALTPEVWGAEAACPHCNPSGTAWGGCGAAVLSVQV